MPMEYSVILMIAVGISAGSVYALFLKYQLEKETGEEPRPRFEEDVLEQIRHVKGTGQWVVLREQGWPTVEIHPESARERDPLDKLQGSVRRYDGPTEPVGGYASCSGWRVQQRATPKGSLDLFVTLRPGNDRESERRWDDCAPERDEQSPAFVDLFGDFVQRAPIVPTRCARDVRRSHKPATSKPEMGRKSHYRKNPHH